MPSPDQHTTRCKVDPWVSTTIVISVTRTAVFQRPLGVGKWLKEAIGRILCPEGRRPFIWAARRHAAHAAYPGTSPDSTGYGDRHPRFPYSALLRTGFTVPSPSPERRCALTAPFHPYPRPKRGRSALCGTFPRVAAAGSYPACLLSWSPDLPPGCEPQRTPASSSRGHVNTQCGESVPFPCPIDWMLDP